MLAKFGWKNSTVNGVYERLLDEQQILEKALSIIESNDPAKLIDLIPLRQAIGQVKAARSWLGKLVNQ